MTDKGLRKRLPVSGCYETSSQLIHRKESMYLLEQVALAWALHLVEISCLIPIVHFTSLVCRLTSKDHDIHR